MLRIRWPYYLYCFAGLKRKGKDNSDLIEKIMKRLKKGQKSTQGNGSSKRKNVKQEGCKERKNMNNACFLFIQHSCLR